MPQHPSSSTPSSYPTPSHHPYTYTLYTFFHSSCSARVRIAAHLKRIPMQYRYIRLHKGEQHLPWFIKKINPSASLPVLVVWRKQQPNFSNPDGVHDAIDGGEEKSVAIITQSIAILEYLEESFPSQIKLLPPVSEPLLRAKVRELTNVVVCDIQPVTNMRVFKKVGELVSNAQGGSDSGSKSLVKTESEAETEKPNWLEDEWQRHFMMLGLTAYEKLLTSSSTSPQPSTTQTAHPTKYSVTDYPTFADIALIAATDRAIRYGIDITQFPQISVVDGAMRSLEAYQRGSWKAQEDTFRSLREKL